MPTGSPTKYSAARSEDIPERGRLVVDIGDVAIGIFRVDGKLYAYENTCPHQGGPVCQGLVIPAVKELLTAEQTATATRSMKMTCASCARGTATNTSIKTGAHPGNPAVHLHAVPVREENGVVYVDL
ncbi:MAG: Rieske 2Fe-2S domain-containing protein [Acidobacteriota bacterium]